MIVNQMQQPGIRALVDYDNSIFDLMQLPEGVDLADVADHIIYKYGDAPLFSPDPETVKFYMGRWSKRRLPLWERYKAAIEAEYNPIENYNRYEVTTLSKTGTIDRDGTNSDVGSGSDSTVRSGSEELAKTGSEEMAKTGSEETAKTGSETSTRNGEDELTYSGSKTTTKDDTTTREVSAFNSGTYDPDNQETLDGEEVESFTNRKDTRTYTDLEDELSYNNRKDTTTFSNRKDTTTFSNRKDTTTYNNITDQTTYGGITTHNIDESQTFNTTDSTTSTISGNIGVTTSQQMLEQEFEVIKKLDLIDYIATDWHQEFNMMIYY